LGCLAGIGFFHVFAVQEEQAERHAAALGRSLARARTEERVRSQFFSIVSHDIRTPLNAILGYSELLQDGIDDPAEREEALKSIRASGTTLLQLVNDVLDLAKMDAGKMTLHPEPVLLSRLADDVFASFRLAASDKGVGLVNGAAGVPAVLLDGHRFRQILFNLVGNAVKFTERGTVTIAASYSGGTLEVSVSDTGCGIAPDMIARVLDPFVQVQDLSHSADRSGGSGLGLSICRSLAKAMGGELVVESELGKGSTFKVVISGVATCANEAAPVANAQPSGATRDFPRRVLIVDDSPVNRSVLAAFLKRADVASTGQARDGAEALAALDSALKAGNPYDFVFSDFWMPNMNGLEFVEKLREDSRFSRLPVYAVTADTEFHGEGNSKLFNGILLKPLTSEKLSEVFAEAEKTA
jgi:CheY-like chemotaxis protein